MKSLAGIIIWITFKYSKCEHFFFRFSHYENFEKKCCAQNCANDCFNHRLLKLRTVNPRSRVCEHGLQIRTFLPILFVLNTL